MLDVKFIRENRESVRKAIKSKQLSEALGKLDDLLIADEAYRLLRQDLEEKQAQRNANSKKIGELKRRGENAQNLIHEMGVISAEVKRLEEKGRSLEAQIQTLQYEIPNLPHQSVPYGETEHDNVVVHERGKVPEFDFEPRPHWELAVQRGWIDFEAGVKLTGAGFPVFKAAGAKLVRGLASFFLSYLADNGFVEVIPPLLVNAASATGTGQLPDKEGQMYEVNEGYYLIPTSEVPVTNLHRGDILDEAELPIKYSAFTSNFRREAGSYGKDVRGLNRVHQFDKVEMVQFSHPDQSYEALEEMTETSEGLLEALGLRYRRLLMCTGDMGFTQAKKYDLEVWSPGQNRWLEVSSISNMEAFQAARLQVRFRAGGRQGRGRTELVHTLNGSALAFPRTIAAIIECYQNGDGTLNVPEVLRPFIGTARLE
ncbi:MAG: serine--tRNA ligase [Trueperaceae bacterium]|nr:MAG: serine--tRNA ligase [Trueperaceae bacterium]